MTPIQLPETRYARSGNVSIAYQVMGDGPVDLIMVPGLLSHCSPSAPLRQIEGLHVGRISGSS